MSLGSSTVFLSTVRFIGNALLTVPLPKNLLLSLLLTSLLLASDSLINLITHLGMLYSLVSTQFLHSF